MCKLAARSPKSFALCCNDRVTRILVSLFSFLLHPCRSVPSVVNMVLLTTDPADERRYKREELKAETPPFPPVKPIESLRFQLSAFQPFSFWLHPWFRSACRFHCGAAAQVLRHAKPLVSGASSNCRLSDVAWASCPCLESSSNHGRDARATFGNIREAPTIRRCASRFQRFSFLAFSFSALPPSAWPAVVAGLAEAGPGSARSTGSGQATPATSFIPLPAEPRFACLAPVKPIESLLFQLSEFQPFSFWLHP